MSDSKLTALKYLSMVLTLLIILPFTGTEVTNASTSKDGLSPALFIDVAAKGNLDTSDDRTIVRTRFVDINFELLNGAAGRASENSEEADIADTIALNLFEEVNFNAVLEHMEPNDSGGYAWIGRLEGIGYSRVVLIIKDGTMAGSISLPGALYEIRYAGNNVHAIYQIDQTAFPGEEPVLSVLLPEEELPRQALTDNGTVIDVMVLYTAATRQALGGTVPTEAFIDLAVAQANDSYVNSGINFRLNLVHTAQVDYAETGNMEKDRNRLQNRTDGYLDQVHALRDTYRADLVSLIVNNGGSGCGISFSMASVSPTFEKYAFSVTKRSCATAYYSFAHELGHNMGARHDWYIDSDVTQPFIYSHGYVNVAGRWRDIMAYENKCLANGVSCPRILYWSNPNITYQGAPLGVAEGSSQPADNTRTLNNTRLTVANFRASASVPTNGSLIYESYRVDDNRRNESWGNTNGVADCGEKIELYVILRNQGSNLATKVKASITTNDSYVTWLNNTSSDYPNISGGGAARNTNDFDLALSPKTPNGHRITFKVTITSTNGGPWSSTFKLPITCRGNGDSNNKLFLPLILR